MAENKQESIPAAAPRFLLLKRAAALLLDLTLLAIPCALAYAVLYYAPYLHHRNFIGSGITKYFLGPQLAGPTFTADLRWTLPFLVAAWFFSEVLVGYTPGKRILKLRVCAADGSKAGFLARKQRWMIKAGIPCGLGFLAYYFTEITGSAQTRLVLWQIPWIALAGSCAFAFGRSRQALHDRVAGTVVLPGTFTKSIKDDRDLATRTGSLLAFLRTAPVAIWRALEAGSGIFDKNGKFSLKGLLLFPWRLARNRFRLFLRGFLVGFFLHLFAVVLSGGFADVDSFPLNLLIPIVDISQPFIGEPSSRNHVIFTFPVALFLWTAVAALISYALHSARRESPEEARGGDESSMAGSPSSAAATAGIAAAVGAWLCGMEDAMAHDTGLDEMGGDPRRFFKEGGARMLPQSAAAGAGAGIGTAIGGGTARRHPDRPDWSLLNQDSDEMPERPEWSELNRPSHDAEWDEESGKWVRKDDLHEAKMKKKGFWKDKYSDSYRKPPPMPETGGAQDDLEFARNQIQDAKDKDDKFLRDVWEERAKIAQARLDAEESVRKFEKKISDAQKAAKQKQVQQRLDSYKNWTWKKVGKEIAGIPIGLVSHLWKTLTDRKYRENADPMYQEAMRKAWQARQALRKGIENQPKLLEDMDKTLKNVRNLQGQVREARAAGDHRKEYELRIRAEQERARMDHKSHKVLQIHEAKKHWERRAAIANLWSFSKAGKTTLSAVKSPTRLYKAGQAIKQRLNNLRQLHRKGQLPWQWKNREFGPRGWELKGGPGNLVRDASTLSIEEQIMNLQHQRGVSSGSRKVAAWNKARDARTTNEALGDYHAVRMQKGAPKSTQVEFSYDAHVHRTKPLFNRMARNSSKNFVVRVKGSKATRAPRATDFMESGKTIRRGDVSRGILPVKKAGADLDMNTRPGIEIIHKRTGRPISTRQMDSIMKRSARQVGADANTQNIHFMHKQGPESLRLRPGTTPEYHLSDTGVRRMNAAQARQAGEVTVYKGHTAGKGLSKADGLSNKCYSTVKDLDRVTKPLARGELGWKRPSYLSKRAEGILRDTASGKLAPGTANRLMRAENGMGLSEVCDKVNTLPEATRVLGTKPSGESLGNIYTFRSGRPPEFQGTTENLARIGSKPSPSGVPTVAQQASAAAEAQAADFRPAKLPLLRADLSVKAKGT